MLTRLILLAVLFFLGYTLFTQLSPRRRERRRAQEQKRRTSSLQGEPMVQDALDGTYLPESLAVTARVGGKTLYFSSTANRDRYLHQRR